MRGFIKGVFAPVAALAASFAITAIGQGVWGALALVNLKTDPATPWAAGVMAVVLAALLAWLGGWGWPRRNSEARRALLRWNPMPAGVFFWAVFTGLLSLVALGGVWIATSDLIVIPAGVQPDMHGIPPTTVIAFLVMGSLAAPLSEEAAFRGYAQGLLQRAWGWAPAAVVGSSLMFAAAHFLQGIDPAKLGLYFLAGLIFGSIAQLTNSLYAAMVVHSAADVMGFTLLWPHDAAPHEMVSQGGYDPLFLPAVIAVVVFLPLALLAFAKLAAMTRGLRRPTETPLGVAAYA